MSFGRQLLDRELDRGNAIKRVYSSRKWVDDLELTHQLYGHTGCVNSLCWSADGQYLASGSDDTYINIYSTEMPSYPLKLRFSTGHSNNIFSIKFMPQTNSSVVVSAAGDSEVRVFDINDGAAKRRDVFRCYADRVKRIVPDGNNPHTFLTCSEDGDVRHIDLRQPSRYYTVDSAPPPLISYRDYRISLNALTMAPSQPQYLVIGGSHWALFLHDRRFLARDIKATWGMPTNPDKSTQCVRRFAPRSKRGHHVTSARFSTAHPSELVGSWSAEGIYLFNIHSGGQLLEDVSGIMLSTKSKPKHNPRASSVDSEESSQSSEHREEAMSGNSGSPTGRKRRRNSYVANSSDDPVVDGAESSRSSPSSLPSRPNLHNLRKTFKRLRVSFFKHQDFPSSSREANALLQQFSDFRVPLNWAQFEVYKLVVAIATFLRRREASITNRYQTRERRRIQGRRNVGAVNPDEEVDASDSEEEWPEPKVAPGWSPRYDVMRCLFQHGFNLPSRKRTILPPHRDIFSREQYDNHEPLLDPDRRANMVLYQSEYLMVQVLQADVECPTIPMREWWSVMVALLKVEVTKITDEVLNEAFGPNWYDKTDTIDVNLRRYDPSAAVQGPRYHEPEEEGHASSALTVKQAQNSVAISDSAGVLSDIPVIPDDENDADYEPDESDEEGSINSLYNDGQPGTSSGDMDVDDEDGYEMDREDLEDDHDGYEGHDEDDEDDEDELGELDIDDEDGTPWLRYTINGQGPSSAEGDVPFVAPLNVYRGHCNVQTVKDVNFFGADDEYIMSGSDSGHLFVWEKSTGRIVQILDADTEIVNVMQPHPYIPQVAVSGIDRTVKIFSPYSLDYSPKPHSRRENTGQRASIRLLDRVEAFETYVETYPRAADARKGHSTTQSSNEDDSGEDLERAHRLEEELIAPRKFLGPSRMKMSDEYNIVATNEQNSRQGMVDTGFTRHILADLAVRIRQGGGAGEVVTLWNDNEEGECVIA
ncbi:WD40-repeat-containing domain protein [Lipomyces kononenkoae]|uniref:WD40-repeat-containing domain protein n=1 Tax=Lipomyces kononenkoae TaxID=34357 RepID=A0ACC3T2A3_LIPKO